MKQLPIMPTYKISTFPEMERHRVYSSDTRHILLYRMLVLFLIISCSGILAGFLSSKNTTCSDTTDGNAKWSKSTASPIDFNIKFAFTPNNSACSPKYVVPLGSHIYVSVCHSNGDIKIDVRHFMGTTEGSGIYPTIKGIALSEKQFEIFLMYSDTIMNFVQQVRSSILSDIDQHETAYNMV